MGRIKRKDKCEYSENNIPLESSTSTKPSDQLDLFVLTKSRRKRMALSDKTNAVDKKNGLFPPITSTKGCDLKEQKESFIVESNDFAAKKLLAPSNDENVTHSKLAKKANKRKGASDGCKENILLPTKRVKTRNQTKVALEAKPSKIDTITSEESKNEASSKTEHAQIAIRPDSPAECITELPSEKNAKSDYQDHVSSLGEEKLPDDNNDEYWKAYKKDCKTPQKGTNDTLVPITRSRVQLKRQRKSKYDNDEWVTQKCLRRPVQSDEKKKVAKTNKVVNSECVLIPSDSSTKIIKNSYDKSAKSCNSSSKTPTENKFKESSESRSENSARTFKKGFLQRIAEKMGESSVDIKPGCSSDFPLDKTPAVKKAALSSKGKEIKSKVKVDSGRRAVEKRQCAKITPSKTTSPSTVKAPLTPYALPPTNLFSIFKKPITPRRVSSENKIFVSSCEVKNDPASRGKPVYAHTKMTPIRRKTRAEQQIEGLYEFEVDENEPKPTKKRQRIMKIQRMRGTRKKKQKQFIVDPEMEMKVLRTLELSPSVFNVVQKPVEKRPLPVTIQDPQEDYHEDDWNGAPSDVETCDEDEHFTPGSGLKSSTPFVARYSASPAHFQLDTSTHSDVSAIEFQVAPSSAYSPVKSKDSPIPVFLANQRDICQKSFVECDKPSISSNISRSSGYSVYQNELDIGASTPVRRLNNTTTFIERKIDRDVELNLSNCFGFDEPEIMEEPLVSPIKSTIREPMRQAPSQGSILKKRPPTSKSAPVDVKEIIKQLRFEVGEATVINESTNVSVFEDFAPSPILRSPLKSFLRNKGGNYQESTTENTTVEEAAPVSRNPRFSYERPNLRKRPVIWNQTDYEASDNESDDSASEEGVQIQAPLPNRKVKLPTPKKKKGMTKKEEEELEKWAKMFNSQCEQVDNYGLCVE